MNIYAIRAIYRFEMARTWRTLMQSIAAPILSTSLYFVVFGAAIGSRMGDIDGVTYGAFIIPGLIMLSLLSMSISNASFGIYMPKFSGTIYEVLSAPISPIEIVIGYASELLPQNQLFWGCLYWLQHVFLSLMRLPIQSGWLVFLFSPLLRSAYLVS